MTLYNRQSSANRRSQVEKRGLRIMIDEDKNNRKRKTQLSSHFNNNRIMKVGLYIL